MPSKTAPVERLYKIPEVAKLKLIGYGESKVRELIADNKLRTVNLREPGDKQDKRRVPESAIVEFLQKYGIRQASFK